MFILFFLLFTAESQILSEQEISDLLGPFPVLGTADSQADFDELLRLQKTRTKAECEAAAKNETPTLLNLFSANDGPLTETEAKRISIELMKVYLEAGINIKTAKKHFERPRPYVIENKLKPCIKLEDSYAYPSGHATLGYMLAQILVEKYPERRETILRRAEQVAHNRVLGGVHHPSDIIAAKKLAEALANLYLAK
ncbi:MAG: phosphatase PAP2 family protein [Bacteriovoracaceae bacterium]|nr:phosphatase PAP2 family protein [Bacteriovoracaceae bacterium]